MAFHSRIRRTEEVHVSRIRVFNQSSVVPPQQHDHDSKSPESWFVLQVATCTRFVDQLHESIGSTTTFNQKPFPFDRDTLSSASSLEVFANSIAQETGLFSRENCRLLAEEISDGLLTKFKFSKDAIYGTTTSLAILVQVTRAVLEEVDLTDFLATLTDHGSSADLELQENFERHNNNTGSTETADSHHDEEQQENDRTVVTVPATISGTHHHEVSFEDHEVPAPTGWDIETSMDHEERDESCVFLANTDGRDELVAYHRDEGQENDHADRSEVTSSADDEEHEDHAVATSTALNCMSYAGDHQEQVNHVVAAPTSCPGELEQDQNHVDRDAFGNDQEQEQERSEYNIYDDSVRDEMRDYDVYSSGTEEEEERDNGVYNDSGEEEDDDERESLLDSSLDVFDDGFFDNHDDLVGDGPEGYEEVVAFEVIVGEDCRNVMIESNDDPCPICLEAEYSSCGSGGSIEVAKTHCGHKFHKDCIAKWMATHMTCPFCRSDCIALV